MRKISELASMAFIKGENFKRDNTEVEVEKDHLGQSVFLYLHSNQIAELTDGQLTVTLAANVTPGGVPSRTTRERLNGLLATMNRPERFWRAKGRNWFGSFDGSSSRIVGPSENITINIWEA